MSLVGREELVWSAGVLDLAHEEGELLVRRGEVAGRPVRGRAKGRGHGSATEGGEARADERRGEARPQEETTKMGSCITVSARARERREADHIPGVEKEAECAVRRTMTMARLCGCSGGRS